MPLKRSESARTTLSMYAQRTGKYQKWLASINVLLLLSSLILLVMGIILRIYYHMDKLGFVSSYFEALPVLLIILGVFLFIFAALGFIFASVESKPALIVYAVIMALVSLGQISVVFLIMESRTLILQDQITVNIAEPLNDYHSEHSIYRNSWDSLQQRLRCCGFNNYLDHYAKYNKTERCVPDSCCIVLNEDGTCDRMSTITEKCSKKLGELWDLIYMRGCLTILKEIYKQELVSQLLIFGLFDVLVVLLEIVACALAAAYVAQITRRHKKMYWNDGGRTFGGGQQINIPLNGIEQAPREAELN